MRHISIERIARLRAYMREKGYDFFIIYTSDPHLSEYVSDVDKAREYFTGFTGSAGTFLVSLNESHLWVDGRYFIQAEQELEGSEIIIMKSGEKDVLTITEFLKKRCVSGNRIAIDGKTISKNGFDKIKESLGEEIDIDLDVYIPNDVWPERKLRVFNPLRLIGNDFSGVDSLVKINNIRKKISDKLLSDYSDYAFIISDLTSVMWVLNLRGSDIKYVPVGFSYLIIYREYVELYVDVKSISNDIISSFEERKIICHEYDGFYKSLNKLSEDICVFADPTKCNSLIFDSISNRMIFKINEDDYILKYKKNEVEIANMRKYHIEDAIAMIHFIYDIKKKAQRNELSDEYEEGRILDEYRLLSEHCYDLSFDTISAYGINAALPHYSATKDSCCKLESKGFYLVDSGGQYPSCTTDITRTISVGPCNNKEKEYYTAVLKGNLDLYDATFIKGCRGENLDILARKPLWDLGVDYRHGTGHGIGCELSVHEGPISIRYRIIKESIQPILEAGMVISDEPGVYFENEFGIRLENELLVVKKNDNEWGEFLGFESLTLVPFDKDSIIPSMLSPRERDVLNKYHAEVYDKLNTYFEGDELKWLKNETAPI